MREILFRGKRTDNGKWIEGSYFHHHNRQPCCIGDNDKESDWDDLIVFSGFADWNMPKPINAVSVIRETVGQYTGMNDKNGKRIFEGDIVSSVYDRSVNYVVCYDLAGFYLKHSPPEEHGFSYTLLPLSNYQHAHGAIIEVIGNIHDNPELLKNNSPSI